MESIDYRRREIPKECPKKEVCIRLRESNYTAVVVPEINQLMADAQTFTDKGEVDKVVQQCWGLNGYKCFMRTEGRRLWMPLP